MTHHPSSTKPPPHRGASAATGAVPRHVAIIMDGNRRWARNRGLPKATGHAAGARRVKELVTACVSQGVQCLTLFAFSTENWRRPQAEVTALMSLLMRYLRKELGDLHAQGVRLRVIGDATQLSEPLRQLIGHAHQLTAGNRSFTLNVAINYGGRWDILQAVRAWQQAHPDLDVDQLDEAGLAAHLSTAGQPEPDLLIRTGGEIRVSNFLLWQMAYAELHFTDVLFPEFGPAQLAEAIAWYAGRERRFGAETGQSGALDSTATPEGGANGQQPLSA
ncbi:MAG: polyprenyl diphosphate synthase [Comamonas sp.]